MRSTLYAQHVGLSRATNCLAKAYHAQILPSHGIRSNHEMPDFGTQRLACPYVSSMLHAGCRHSQRMSRGRFDRVDLYRKTFSSPIQSRFTETQCLRPHQIQQNGSHRIDGIENRPCSTLSHRNTCRRTINRAPLAFYSIMTTLSDFMPPHGPFNSTSFSYFRSSGGLLKCGNE